MKTELKHFDNLELENSIRVQILEGNPWFIAKDVCESLGLENNRRATDSLDADELLLLKVTSGGQKRDLQAVSESGLYALIFKSKKPEAKKFRKWVTSEVLPAIRQQGKYDPAVVLASLPPLVRHAAAYDQITALEAQIIRLRAEADAAITLAGQFTVHIWCLMRGEDIQGITIGHMSSACKRHSILTGAPIGHTRVVQHCGQITRLSRNALTFDPAVLAHICGPISTKQPA